MLVLLLGTAAPALARMTCVMGGHSVLTLGQAADCTPVDHTHTATTVQATCCEVLQAQPQRTDFVPTANPMVPTLFAMVMPESVYTVEATVPVVRSDAWSSRPPPLPRSQRLATTGVFLL
jgi:hypothetical protein